MHTLHELQWSEDMDGGSYWTCTLPNCGYVEFQFEDTPGGR